MSRYLSTPVSLLCALLAGAAVAVAAAVEIGFALYYKYEGRRG